MFNLNGVTIGSPCCHDPLSWMAVAKTDTEMWGQEPGVACLGTLGVGTRNR